MASTSLKDSFVDGEVLGVQWDYSIVFFSYVVSVLGCWCAFLMVEQGKMATKASNSPHAWTMMASLALGGCKDGIHFWAIMRYQLY